MVGAQSSGVRGQKIRFWLARVGFVTISRLRCLRLC
jgi:hypothetical protein